MKIDLSKKQESLVHYINNSIVSISSLNKEKVGYLLTQIRKVLEIAELDKDKQFITLSFFIDWSLHSYVDRSSKWYQVVKEEVMSSIENSKNILASKGIEREIDIKQYWNEEILNHIQLKTLKENLETFSNRFGVDFTRLFEIQNFGFFRDIVMEILAEIPIEIKDLDCPIKFIFISDKKNKTDFNHPGHVCDYILVFRDETIYNCSFIDGTLPIMENLK